MSSTPTGPRFDAAVSAFMRNRTSHPVGTDGWPVKSIIGPPSLPGVGDSSYNLFSTQPQYNLVHAVSLGQDVIIHR